MDEIATAEVVIQHSPEKAYTGPVAKITTRRGRVYHVWIGDDDMPLIELLSRKD